MKSIDIVSLVLIVVLASVFIPKIIPSNKVYCFFKQRESMTDIQDYDGFPGSDEFADQENVHDLIRQLV